MDFDNVKENIQPLAAGRNVSLLQASLRNDSPQEILAQRKEFEVQIKNYVGSDPLDPWYSYIGWIEQSYPSGGSESGLLRVLSACLSRFENDERYRQDRRFIKLFIKFMANQKDQIEVYQELYNNGIGTMVADFYIAWAYSYDLCGNTRKADEIFRLGIACRAQPFEELQEAHQHFGYSLSQRMLYMEGDKVNVVNQQLNERRVALQSLRSHRQKGTVGSIRTGAAVKSETPGLVPNEAPTTSRGRNTDRNLNVFNDENTDINTLPQSSNVASENQVEASGTEKSALRSIIDATRDQENMKETGPWNKAHDKKNHKKLFSGSTHNELSFTIHTDEFQSNYPPITNYERNLEKPFKFPPQFAAKSIKQPDTPIAITLEDQPDPFTLPQYNKCMLYPRPNVEFSPEEYRAYNFFKKQNPNHPYVQRQHCYWAIGDPNVNIRRYPNFASASKPQKEDELDKYFKPPTLSGLFIDIDKHYNDEEQEEYQIEELLIKKARFTRNNTIHNIVDMEETVCSIENLPRRKSFFPTPVSINSAIKPRLGRPSVMPRTSTVQEESETDIKIDNTSSSSKVHPTESPPAQIQCKESSLFLVPDIPQISGLIKAPASCLPAATEKKIEIYEDKEPSTVQPPSTGSAFFDADETCSTQMFNIFIKKQSVSTPKAVQKQGAARQFGTLLKEMPVETEPELPKLVEEIPAAEDTAATMRKQLSIILETSEHGTTHGTHSSGGTNATTKSTIITQHFETSSQPTTLEAAAAGAVSVISDTPKPPRLQDRLAQDFDDQEMRRRPHNNEVGNFSRIEQREDTASNLPCMSHLRFQEDKTETITKSILRFQDDKTETIPKMTYPAAARFEGGEQTTGTVPKLPPVLPAIDDDTFDFFTKTPDKLKSFRNIDMKPGTHLSSPLDCADSKRFCNQLTPELFFKTGKKVLEKPKNPIAIFEDEESNAPPLTSTTSKPMKSVLHDSFLPEFSFVEEPKAVAPARSAKEEKPQSSLLGNLSYVPETQEPLASGVSKESNEQRKVQQNFEIFLDETMPGKIEKNSAERKPAAQANYGCDPASTNAHRLLRLSSAVDKENAPSQSILRKLTEACETQAFIDDSSSLSALSISEKKTTSKLAHLTASFMKDFNEINNQSAKPIEPEPMPSVSFSLMKNSKSPMDFQKTATQNSKQNDFFELNAATEMFATNISMIKNSTLLPNHEGGKSSDARPQHNQSVQHSITIKDDSSTNMKHSNTPMEMDTNATLDTKSIQKNIFSKIPLSVSKVPLPSIKCSKSPFKVDTAFKSQMDVDKDDDGNMSIYYKKTPRTPKHAQHSWNEENHEAIENTNFLHNPNVTSMIMDVKNAPDPNLNPFSVDLINGFLEDVEFTLYIEKLPHCELVGHIKRLSANTTITIKDQQFDVIKMIGEGAYGSVYCAKNAATGKKYALKQERPPNQWEYYMCLEVQTRIPCDMIPAFMCVEYAQIGNNASILASEFSTYGSLIAVCNKIKKHTTKNVDEYVAMHLTRQLLSIIDHLHAVNIIHADVKADNFLLMKSLKYPSDEICLQLIDFGVSIDMNHFSDRQTFTYVHNENEMKCVEMRMNRPWTYQLDLYGLAGVIHVLLFGKYMNVERHASKDCWMPKERFPRYFNKTVWESIFQKLLNIRDCTSMPNLQELRLTLKTELAEKERYVSNMVQQFNRALNA